MLWGFRTAPSCGAELACGGPGSRLSGRALRASVSVPGEADRRTPAQIDAAVAELSSLTLADDIAEPFEVVDRLITLASGQHSSGRSSGRGCCAQLRGCSRMPSERLTALIERFRWSEPISAASRFDPELRARIATRLVAGWETARLMRPQPIVATQAPQIAVSPLADPPGDPSSARGEFDRIQVVFVAGGEGARPVPLPRRPCGSKPRVDAQAAREGDQRPAAGARFTSGSHFLTSQARLDSGAISPVRRFDIPANLLASGRQTRRCACDPRPRRA